MSRTKKQDYIYAVGKRKNAVARVRLFKAKGENLVNDKPLENYFSGRVNKSLLIKPFELTDTLGKYYVTVKVEGGGLKGQLEAVVHGISRALAKMDVKLRPIVKKAGLLTRDARTRERRKIGMGGKSRRQKQSPKR